MKKLFKTQTGAYILAVVGIVLLGAILGFSVYKYKTGLETLSTQQQWTSGKEDFDRAFEIAISDKEKPDKTLYGPNLVNNLGKNINDCVANVGQGAKIVSTTPTSTGTDYTIELTNESASVKSVTPKIVASTNSSDVITKLSFSASTWALGYPKLSYVDMINNEGVIEKTLNECGLSVDVGSIKAPVDKSVYTTYASDMTTAVTQSYTFSGKSKVNNKTYSWEANLTYDYSNANVTGNLADTVRCINITVSL